MPTNEGTAGVFQENSQRLTESYSTDSENRDSKKTYKQKKWNKTKIHILVTEEVGLWYTVIKEMPAITTILHCKEDKNVMQHYRRKPESSSSYVFVPW